MQRPQFQGKKNKQKIIINKVTRGVSSWQRQKFMAGSPAEATRSKESNKTLKKAPIRGALLVGQQIWEKAMARPDLARDGGLDCFTAKGRNGVTHAEIAEDRQGEKKNGPKYNLHDCTFQQSPLCTIIHKYYPPWWMPQFGEIYCHMFRLLAQLSVQLS